MVKSLQHQQDIILIPRDWWSDLQDTKGPEEPGWWYTVSRDMWYQGCRSCKKRLGKDHQDAKRCPKCPKKISKRKNSGPKKTQGKSQRVCSGSTNDRVIRSGLNHNYAEPDSGDANMEEDSEEDSDEDLSRPKAGWGGRLRNHHPQLQGTA